jgi:uncharacterized protein (TIRG00374 family)
MDLERMRRRTLSIALIGALAIGLLVAWLSSLDLPATGRALAACSPPWLALVGVSSLLHLVVRSIRWRSLLGVEGRGDARLSDLVSFTFIGYLVSFVMPGRAGELVRPALLWKRAGAPAGRALGSVLLERVLDLGMLAAMACAFAVVDPQAVPAALRSRAEAGLALVLAAWIGVIALLRVRPQALGRIAVAVTARLPRRMAGPAERFSLSLLGSLEVLAAPWAWLRLPALSLLTWTPVLVASLAGLRAAHLDVPVTAPLVLVPLGALGIAVPTPAGVGGFHYALTWGLSHIFGTPSEAALAAAIATHAASVLPVVAVGLYACAREGLSLRSLRAEVEAARSDGGTPSTQETDRP